MKCRHVVLFAVGSAVFAAAFPPNAHAWCAAMGGYSSFEEQARAEARKRGALVVRSDQQSLRTLGFYRGAVDGTEGPATSKAIASFRAAVGLGEGNHLDDDARRRLKVISGNPYTKQAGRIKMSHLGRSGFRSSLDSTACMASLPRETPF